jgi:site-specific DNA-methyltransferase (adenine-specific)
MVRPYYEHDGIVIYHGDCREVLPTLQQVDHVITDPPYEEVAHTKQRRFKSKSGGFYYAPVDFDPIDEQTRTLVGQELARLADGWILVFCQVEAAMKWRAVLEPPARYMRTQIWHKPDAVPQYTGDRPGMGYECIVTCWAKRGRSRWNGGGRAGVYSYPTAKNGTGHFTEKPLPLMQELVSLFTNPGETVLDPFMGSGTTLVAAQSLGRKAIGIEIDERWCEAAAKRLQYGSKGAELISMGQLPLGASI